MGNKFTLFSAKIFLTLIFVGLTAFSLSLSFSQSASAIQVTEPGGLVSEGYYDYLGTYIPDFVGTAEPSLTCTKITFENAAQTHDLKQVLPVAGITFSGNTIGLIDSDVLPRGTGTGNFANEPSPDTIAFWLLNNPDDNSNSVSITFNVDKKKVSFFYASSVILTFEAYNSATQIPANLIQNNALPATPLFGAGDPTGAFATFSAFSFTSPTENIGSVKILGVANQAGIDDLTICEVDITPPTITVPAAATVENGDDDTSAATGVATATDNADPAPAIGESDSVATVTPLGDDGNNVRIITRTWTATDASGNAANADQIITVVDTTAPDLTIPANASVENGDDDTSAATGTATATDTTDPAPAIGESDSVALVTPLGDDGNNVRIITRTWTATDAYGNAANADQIITVVDTTAPDLTIPAAATVENGDDDTSAATGVATATDTTDPAPAIGESDSVALVTPLGDDGNNVRIITRTWTATDAYGNAANADQTVTVIDTTAPALTIPADITIEALDLVALPANKHPTTGAEPTGDATATDITDPAPVIVFGDVSVNPAPNFTTKVIELITRTWTATDVYGNAANADQIITTRDTIAPTVTLPTDILADETTVFTLSADGSVVNTFTHTLPVAGDFSSPPTYTIEAIGPEGADATVHVEGDDVVGLLSLVCTVTSDDATSVNDGDDFDQFANVVAALVDESRDNVFVEDRSTYRITDKDSEDHALSCIGTDAGGNTDTKTGTITVEDTTDPKIIAPPNLPAIDVFGINTPRNVNTATNVANEAEPGGAVAADIVSSLGDGLTVVDDRSTVASIDPGCDETDGAGTSLNGGDVDPCFQVGVTTITYTVNDSASATSSVISQQTVTLDAIPIEIAWDEEKYEIPEGEGYVDEVTDYRGNADNDVIETITVQVKSQALALVINVDIAETGKNTGVFQPALDSDPITFSTTTDDDATDTVKVNTFDTVLATRTHAADDNDPNPTSATADADIFDPNVLPSLSPGAITTATERVTFDKDVYVIESGGQVQILTGGNEVNDFNDQRNTNPGSKQAYNNRLTVTSTSDMTGFPIKIKENSINNDNFKTRYLFTVTATCPSVPASFALCVAVGDEIFATYTALGNDPILETNIIPSLAATVIAPESGAELEGGIAINTDTILTCDADLDGDAICTEYEDAVFGLTIPFDNPVTLNEVTYTLDCTSDASLCPDPNRKDIYLEIDYMSGHRPDQAAIDLVVQSFDISNVVNSVTSPDPSKSGVALHVLVGDDIQTHRNSIPFDSADPLNPGFVQFKEVWFGTPTERGCVQQPDDSFVCPDLDAPGNEDLKADVEDRLVAKRQVFHYAIWGHGLEGQLFSSGYGELLGNDFMVTMGEFSGGVGTTKEQAATMKHELGHNLGLSHAGKTVRTGNCSTPYLSVMSYAYQFDNLVSDRPLAFSTKKLPAISPTSLIESTPIKNYNIPVDPSDLSLGVRSANYVFGSPVDTSDPPDGIPDDVVTVVVPTGGVAHFANPGDNPGKFVDWNQDGVHETDPNITFSVPVTNLGIPGCDFDALGLQRGWNDYKSLKFNFKTSTTFSSGAFTSVSALNEPDLDVFNQIRAAALGPLASIILGAPDADLLPLTRFGLLTDLDEIDSNILENQLATAIANLEVMKAAINPTIANPTLQDQLVQTIDGLISIYTEILTPSDPELHEESEIPKADTFPIFYSALEGAPITLDGSLSTDPDRCVVGIFCTALTAFDWILEENSVGTFMRFDEDTSQALLPSEFGDGESALVSGTIYFVPLQVTDDGLDQDGDAYIDPTGSRISDRDRDVNDVAIVTITNVAPSITGLSATTDPTPLGTAVGASATFTDPGWLDTHDITGEVIFVDGTFWDWDSDDYHPSFDETTLAFSDGSVLVEPPVPTGLGETDLDGTIVATHTYPQTGVYVVRLTVEDDDGGTDTLQTGEFVVIYDPTGGFATGGGKIFSPAAAFDAKKLGDEFPDTNLLEGDANFGFVSKYKKGATVPEGNTNFRFQTGNMQFESTSYDFLVISGARAQYMGDGIMTTVNSIGEENQIPMKFMLKAQDCDVQPTQEELPDPDDFCGEGEEDKFRIKLFLDGGGGVVYDNERGAEENEPLTSSSEITNGSITIHKDKPQQGGGKK